MPNPEFPGSLTPRLPAIPFEPGSSGYDEAISKNIAAVGVRIAAACEKASRISSEITLLAVTKFNPVQAVQAAYKAGLRNFGENRVQEATEKYAQIGNPGERDFKLHLLGHLQSNKAKKALEVFDCIQSVDSLAILKELIKKADSAEKKLDLLFELHTGEESKSGFPDSEALYEGLKLCRHESSIRVRGLMTMAPYTDDPLPIQRSFRACKIAFDEARTLFDFPMFDTLSMGMTNDLEIAIEEGATLVRIGTALFGARNYA